MLRWAPLVTLLGCAVEPALLRSVTVDVVAPATEQVARTSMVGRAAAAVCEGIAPCEVVGVRPVMGSGEDRYAVAIVARRRDYATRRGAAGAHLFDGRADVFVARDGDCEPFEAWLMAVTGDHAVRERRLARICNEHDFAYHNAAERLEVRGDTITRTLQGNTGLRWSQTATMRLPDGAVAFEERVAWEGDDRTIATRSNERAARATMSWALQPCDPAQPGAALPRMDVSGEAIVVPSLDLPRAFHAGGWKTAQVATCAAHIDGAIVAGAATGVATASIDVFVADATVFVEIHDDDLSATGAAADRLELWSSDLDPRFDEGCVARSPLAGFEVRVAGGAARALGGGGAAPSVARAVGPDGAVRLAVTYLDPPRALSLVYRDVDRGKPATDIASGMIDPADATSAGSVRRVDAPSCSIETPGPRSEPHDPLALDLFRLDVFVSSDCSG
jgi:hypothetical protein